jgi:hypothetical protein
VWLESPEYERDNYPANVGTALHEATQEWIRALHEGKSETRADVISEYTLLKFWPWEEEEKRLLDKRALGSRTLGSALLMLEEIKSNFIWNDWELVEIEGFGPAIEVPYRIVHTSLGLVPLKDGLGYIATQGKIDFILRHRKTRHYKVVDLKTTEKSIPSHDAAFRFSGQGGHYGLVLSHALGIEWQTQGIDVTYLVAWFSPYELKVYPLDYHYDYEEMQDQITAKLDRVERMKRYAMAEHWPRRQHGCEFWNTPCGFLDICHRRDKPFIKRWFEFERATGRFKQYDRTYEPVWTLEA